MFYRTAQGSPLPRDPLTAIVSPRPIAWITTRGGDGRINLSPYSFFNAVAYTPPQVIVASIGNKADREIGKDTFAQASETGVLCINIAGYEDRDALNASSAPFPAAVDEAAHLGLELAECETIDCPRLAHAPAALECRLTRTLDLEGEANRLMIARIEAIHLRDDCLDGDGRFDVTRFRPLTRLGYSDFGAITEVFRMPRPKLPD
ncbi:flavin reductase family protein [Mangrovicoccus algicola]|uniref:Flavin reductase family protein n=1 Tax=Mangrovicoccus algicola TaxID=2771008 RepID=A0A8J6Z942_9RHOB|nr:flavin reductase family protein [Mangrovicoccus algicola]MBE3638525.1 flavin reductase family protein [Mangrovicoccus algicola]